MKVSTAWLKDYVGVDADTHDIAETLTMTLNEVDEIHSVDELKGIVTGEIIKITKHPGADRLNVTKTKVGANTHTIVCGAPNIFEGAKVAVALPGTVLPDGLLIERTKIRGVVSEGMICSPKELALSDDHSGVWILPADTKTGVALAKAVRNDHDTFELEVLYNRPDVMGHLGIARELASAYKASFKEPSGPVIRADKSGYPARLRDAYATRYSLARLTDVTNTESPDWLKRRLESVGLRPISAVVDVTNFVMLEYGQPLHGFDAAKVTGPITVSAAKAGQSHTTLDGAKRVLPEGVITINDTDGAIGIGGIMGGQRTEVTEATTDVLLEAARFDPVRIRRGSRKLGLRTEASARFERGIPEAFTMIALARAISLLKDITGAKLAGVTDVYPKPTRPKIISLDHGQLERFLGIGLPKAKAATLLRNLGFTVKGSGPKVRVTVPYWRADVSQAADLYEEVARAYGYNNFPSTVPTVPLLAPTIPETERLSNDIRTRLVMAGMTEVLTHSLVGDALLDKTGRPPTKLVKMANPLSEDHAYLRPSLAPRHLEAVATNLRWRDTLRFFEVGTVFEQTPKGPVEHGQLLLTLASSKQVDLVPELMGLLGHLLTALGAPDSAAAEVAFCKDRLTSVNLNPPSRPRKAKFFAQASISLKWLSTRINPERNVTIPPEYPSIRRDLSVYMPEQAAYSDLEKIIRKEAGEYLVSVAPVGQGYFEHQGRRSITVQLEFNSRERTLTDVEVNQRIKPVSQSLEKAGYELRD